MVVAHAAEAYRLTLLKLPLALPVKARVFGMHPELTPEDMAVKGAFVRTELQQEGTERGRDTYGSEFWVRQHMFIAAHLRDTCPDIHGVVVPDVRFANEVAYTSQHGISVRVKSDRPTLSGEFALHKSETEMQSIPDSAFDTVVWNGQEVTLSALAQRAPAILKYAIHLAPSRAAL